MGFFNDLFKGVSKIFTKVISWFVPVVSTPDLSNFNQEEQKGILVNKQLIINIYMVHWFYVKVK